METPEKAIAATDFNSLSITVNESGEPTILINGETPANLASVYFSWYPKDKYGYGGTSFDYSIVEPAENGKLQERKSFSLCRASIEGAKASLAPIPESMAHKPPALPAVVTQDTYKAI